MVVIPEDQRTLAALTHLSGLAGYIIPFGGALVPIIIWVVKSDSPLISTIAKQALWLNILGFILGGLLAVVGFFLALTVILIPVVVLLALGLSVALIGLPIVGAIKAWDGQYYKYPVVGLSV